jgi:hypothetical protein
VTTGKALACAVAAAVFGFVFGLAAATREEQTVCRHTIQRAFGKTRAEAESLIAAQREWER